jgi:hypothetical protein
MRCVEVAAGTLGGTAVCEFPPGFDAARVLALRFAGAGVIIPRVDFDIPGDDAARKPTSG